MWADGKQCRITFRLKEVYETNLDKILQGIFLLIAVKGNESIACLEFKKYFSISFIK